MQKKKNILTIIWVAIAVFSATPLNAQVDTTEAKYRQAELIDKCRLNMNAINGKRYMDDLFKVSASLDDTRGQLLALQYLLLNYINTDTDINTIREATDSLKSFSLHHYNKISYYFGWSQYVEHLISGDTTMHIGKSELEKMTKEVLEDNHVYGSIQCYRRFMSYYNRLHLWRQAIGQNKEALTITEQSDPENNNLSIYYLDHAKLLRKIGDYDEAYRYIQKGLATHREKFHKLQLTALKCQLDAEMGRYEEVVHDYNELTLEESDIPREHISLMKLMLSAVAADKLMARYDIELPYKAKESMLEYAWTLDSISNRVSELMGDESLKQLDTNTIFRQQGELERAAGATRRMIGRTLLGICSVLIITLIVLIIRNRKNNLKMREQTSAFAMKNVHLQQKVEELQSTINAIKSSHDDIKRRYEDITKDSRMKSTFILSLAKELRLVALNGLNKATIPQLLEYAKNMEILQNLATREHIAVEDIELNSTCRKIFDKYLLENTPSKEVTFYFEPTAETSAYIKANTELLTLIISNLLRLSQQYTRRGEIILKTRRAQNGHLQVIVTDTGEGIPICNRERMFERLAEMEDSDTGTLLHLTICRVAAHSQNFRIWLDTSRHLAVGTTIIVEF